MASIAITETPWKSAPSYPALYLSTVSEYLPASAKPKLPDTAEVVDPAGKDVSWISEAYENSMDTDHAFDRFSKRVEAEPEQCVRYDLKGTPLPFQSDEVFNRLFPLPDAPPPAVTKAAFTVTSPQKRSFDPTSIPVCPVCRSKRVFECQLMPNLINVLRPKEGRNQKLTDEERRTAVEEALKKGKQDERRAMEWGTCMIFSCEKDCCLEDGSVKEEAKYSWREEEVLVQWDT
jgi:pre-rRNA-processing protein TSR4